MSASDLRIHVTLTGDFAEDIHTLAKRHGLSVEATTNLLIIEAIINRRIEHDKHRENLLFTMGGS